mmetsp:Transcript_12497/g.25957  ORF Transcript_12497/g.25957 Transcript_12497/m.25957 type:complete len:131 (-) Transcript_12497:218-610(-)
MKTGAIVGFAVLGAVVVIALIVFVYQRKLNKVKKEAKTKFASRMAKSMRMTGSSLEHERRSELIKKFDTIDEDSSGTISKDELWEYITKQDNQNMTKQEFDALFKTIDKDLSGQIDLPEFLMFMSQLVKE